MVVSIKQQTSKFPTIDISSSPKVDRVTALRYWLHFLYRFYFVGRKKHGPYGPPRCAEKTQKIEESIKSQSIPYGDAPTLPIPELTIDEISPQQFQEIYVKRNTPVVLRGAAKNWEAVQTWTPEFFGTKYGNEIVSARVRADQLNEEALLYLDLPLSEVLENIKNGGTYFPGHTEDLFNRNPSLRDALDLKMLGEYLSIRQKRIMSTQLFLSGGGVRSWFHATCGPNLFTMVYGRKEWTLVHPKHSLWMHPITRKDMFYNGTMIDWKKTNDEIEADGYPLYRYIPKFSVTLEPGDILFSPQWWWHCVDTPEPSIGIASRAINDMFIGHELFSLMWVTSNRFRQTVWTCFKDGWGSDAATGAKLAFEFDQKEFVRRLSV